MSEDFIQPEPDEVEAVLPHEPTEQDLDAIEVLPIGDRLDNFKSRWEALGELDLEALLGLIGDGIAARPREQRELLVTWIALHLGLSRRKVAPKRLERGALLWELLGTQRFGTLNANAHDALLAIAQSTHPERPTLHPLAAMAAIALWRNEGAHAEVARELLATRALPDEPIWLHQLIKRYEALDQKDPVSGRTLLDLAGLQRSARFWNVTALIAGLHFVNQYGRWSASKLTRSLIIACDRAATQHPTKETDWILLMCEAVLGGALIYPWAERVMEAGIRLSIQDEATESKLRAYHRRRPYDASHARLLQLYGARAETWSRQQPGGDVGIFFEQEGMRLRALNPTRAQRLLEMALVRRAVRRRAGSLERKLQRALAQTGEQSGDLSLVANLLELYVQNYEIDATRARFVHRWSQDARLLDRVDQDELELYLIIGDYERAFEHLTCKYDGVSLHHADKHAATRVKYFIEKRVQPGSVTRMVDAAFSPLEWLGASLGDVSMVQDAVERGIEHFEARIKRQDLRRLVVEELRESGASIEGFEEIGQLSIDHIEVVLRKRKSQRLLLGALAGGISGGLAPLGWGVASLADIPVVLSLTADICARFCWYYGFDPAQEPELPMEILAVALGGSKPAAIEPMLLRQNMREFAVRKSVMVGALAKGALNQAAGRAFNQLLEKQMAPQLAQRARAIARRAVQKNFEHRAVNSTPGKALPLAGALLGAALNAALIYDLCEAAQAVLTDRFLERKYPDWVRHFDLRMPQDGEEE